VRGSLRGRVVWTNIGSRFLMASFVALFAMAVAPWIVLMLLGRFVLTGRRPDDLGTPKPPRDLQAEKMRRDLEGAATH